VKKTALALVLVITVLLFGYLVLVISSHEEVNSSPTASPLTPSSSASPAPTFTPTPSPSATPSPTATSILSSPESVSYWNASSDVFMNAATVVIIDSPENDTTYFTNSVTLTVHVGTQLHYIRSVYYTADWLERGSQIFYHLASYGRGSYLMPRGVSITMAITGIPAGNHSITVFADSCEKPGETPASSSVNFIIDIK
jgi:hypothetical protein